MGTFIVNLLQYNKKENRFYVRGGSSNIVPRPNNFTHYDKKEFLLLDLISGCIDLRCNNTLSNKCKDAVKVIEQNWKSQFKERNESFGGMLSINPYSLYYISLYSSWNKEETIKNSYNVSHYAEEYKKEALLKAKAIEEVWDEAILFFNEQINIFFNLINIPQN